MTRLATHEFSSGALRLDRSREKIVAGRLWGLALVWYERARQRRALRYLDEHRLRDIGKTRAQALAEANKPFWRA